MVTLASELVSTEEPPRRLSRRWRYSLRLWIPLTGLVLMLAACFLAPLVLHIDPPNGGLLTQAWLPPFSAGHLLGTDGLGNDVLSRCLYGGRVSFEVGFSSIGLGLIVGGTLGMVAGIKRGIVDVVIMRVLDIILAFPSLVLAMAVASYLGPNERDVIFAIAFFTIPAFARLARANTLRIRNQLFVVASRLSGQKDRRIISGHVVPHVLPRLLTFGLLTVGIAMIIEAALDFLGVGVRPPQPSWGAMMAAGQPNLSNAPWILFAPACFLFLTVVCINLLGDELRARWEDPER